MNKIDYNIEMHQTMDELKNRPSLLLHACCAPCASAVLPILTKSFDVDVIFSNSNITDASEYEHRLSELKRLLNIYNQRRISPKPIGLIPARYSPSEFYDVATGLEAEREGGMRCNRCFRMRLEETCRVAKQKNYEYFCTTLTVSPHKNAVLINTIGEEVSDDGGVKYLASDFKKQDGYKKSIEICREYEIYRQSYCGCEFSEQNTDK